MAAFELDPHLAHDCVALGRLGLCRVLLMNNPAVPWFILVPETTATELCDLEAGEQARLLAEINAVSHFVRDHFTVDKLNVASIGNIVRQLHVHVVGRRVEDDYWPGVVWGAASERRYGARAVADIAAAAGEALGDAFRVAADG